MPEVPELQAHAERIEADFGGAVLAGFRPITFTALKTYAPDPASLVGRTLRSVGRRGKYLLLDFDDATFVVHLMQGGRLKPDEKQSAKPRGGIARWTFEDGRALLLTEPGTERKAGVWVVAGDLATQEPLAGLGPEAASLGAAELGERADGRIARIGVFVDEKDAEISEVVEAARLNAIQLHGDETPERAAQLRSRFGLPVWKVIAVASESDLSRADTYRQAADFILFDAKTPKGTLPGGMGLSFDWALLKAYRGAMPWGLAGGLTPDNVAQAAQLTGAPLVDAASGTESAPGVKDVDKIAAFCKAARQP